MPRTEPKVEILGQEQSAKAEPIAKRVIPPRLGPGALSDAALPQASLPTMMRLAGTALAGPGSLTDLLSRIPERERPTADTAKRGLEILRRAGFISFDGVTITSTADLAELDRALPSGRLDDISAKLERFEPYSLVLQALRERGQLARDEVEIALKRSITAPLAKEASERLLRFSVLLGQSWTDDRIVRDGSHRPSPTEALKGLYFAFRRTSRDGLARVSDLLPAFCRDIRISPWAAERLIADLVVEGQLSELSFQPAAGEKPTGRDQVISGTLQHPELVVIPIDRIAIGGRPVFTVSGDLT
jgi:hypothetical protein